MPYALENWGSKAIVVNSATGKHFSKNPIPLVNAKRQIRLLRAVEHGMKPRRAKPMDS